jgi:cytochrome c553
MKGLFRVITCLTLLAAQAVLAQGDAASGQEKSTMCAACHGADGNSTLAMWPKLAGQHAPYLERQIGLIKSGARPVPEMTAFVAGLSEQDIADISAYFASQKSKPALADPALVAVGERLYRAGNAEIGIPACMACHGPAGEGNPLAGYPALAGQHSVYLVKMLNSYKSATTWGEDDEQSNVMAGVALRLSESEINAVSSYIQGLYSKDSE